MDERDLARSVKVENLAKELTVSEVARLTNEYYYCLIPLGMLVNLVGRRSLACHAAMDALLRQEAAKITERVNPVVDEPRRPVQAQLGAILLTSLAAQQVA